MSTTNDLILAIDLGKYKSVVCTYRTPEDHQFTKISTSRDELTKLIRRVQPAVVLVEACLLSGWVHDLCCTLGVKCLVANTSSEAWKFKHSKRKTDKDDAEAAAVPLEAAASRGGAGPPASTTVGGRRLTSVCHCHLTPES
jgi:transposase